MNESVIYVVLSEGSEGFSNMQRAFTNRKAAEAFASTIYGGYVEEVILESNKR